MANVRIIPVLLLNNGGLYKTTRFKDAKYVGDPINTVRIFNDKEADELVLLDYTASVEKHSIDYKKISEIAGEAFMPMAYGGAIHCFGDAVKVFESGYEKIVLNSILFEMPQIIKKIAGVYGAQAVVGSMDVKKTLMGKYKVFSYSGTKNSGNHPVAWARQLEENGAGEIFLNSIDKDGTWDGYDYELIDKVSKSINIPVIACGGAGNINDFAKAVNAGASAVAAGSMFVYQKKGMGVLISFPGSLNLKA